MTDARIVCLVVVYIVLWSVLFALDVYIVIRSVSRLAEYVKNKWWLVRWEAGLAINRMRDRGHEFYIDMLYSTFFLIVRVDIKVAKTVIRVLPGNHTNILETLNDIDFAVNGR